MTGRAETRQAAEREVVDRETWLAARRALLDEEIALTRARDRLAEARRALPRVRIATDYRFVGPEGALRLGDLFGPHGQLAVYHFMFGPDWDAGCPICSFWMDSLNGLVPHLAARGVSLVLVSAAPLEKLEAYRDRMGWDLRWVSTGDGRFNRDFGVSFSGDELAPEARIYNYGKAPTPGPEAPGFSTFERDADGAVYHCYSAYARGLEAFNAAYGLLDLMPRGRDEGALPFPMAWLRRRDSYAG